MSRFVFRDAPPSLVAQAAPLYADLAAIPMQLALIKLALKYRPDQPRVPAGRGIVSSPPSGAIRSRSAALRSSCDLQRSGLCVRPK